MYTKVTIRRRFRLIMSLIFSDHSPYMSLLDMLSEQLAEHDLTDRQRTVALYIAEK